MYIVGACFGLIVLILVIVVFYCGEKNEEDERRKLVNDTTSNDVPDVTAKSAEENTINDESKKRK
jgi:uncharacterized protein (UPF0333 family)